MTTNGNVDRRTAMNSPNAHSLRDQMTEFFAPVMFFASVAFLILLSALLVFWIDVPRVVEVIAEQASWDVVRFVEPTLTASEERYQYSAYLWGIYTVIAIGGLWLLFLVEAITVYALRDRSISFLKQRPYFWIAILVSFQNNYNLKVL